jgi:NAD(P)-dependent dehydrogenase (short-subunit alcohol dehydrogenase family)
MVTGGARGIGRAIAIALAEAGHDVAVADIHPEPYTGERYYRLRQRFDTDSEPTVAVARSQGARALAVEVDVSDLESVRQAVSQIETDLGAVDVLVNNAGIVNNLGTLSDMTSDAWSHEISVNLTGAFHCIQAVAPGCADRGFGRIVNIASVAALRPSPGQPAYGASKAAIMALTATTAATYGAYGVTANAVLPGLIATPLVLSMPEELRESALRRVPAGRLGQPEEIAGLVAFLASDIAAYINGAALPCDGGWLVT